MARVKIEPSVMTYIDKQGNEIFSRFEYISEFNEDGCARIIEQSGKIYYMNRKGIKLKY